MSYTLPDVTQTLVSSGLAQRFVRRTMLSTMEIFRDALEAEAEAAGAKETAEVAPLERL